MYICIYIYSYILYCFSTFVLQFVTSATDPWDLRSEILGSLRCELRVDFGCPCTPFRRLPNYLWCPRAPFWIGDLLVHWAHEPYPKGGTLHSHGSGGHRCTEIWWSRVGDRIWGWRSHLRLEATCGNLCASPAVPPTKDIGNIWQHPAGIWCM